MKKIKITNNLIRSLTNHSRDHLYKTITNDEIFKLVTKTLVFDDVMDKDTLVEYIIIPDKFQGVYIEENNVVISFVAPVMANGKTKGRNTHVSQNFLVAKRWAKKQKSKVYLSVSPIDIDRHYIISAKSINESSNFLKENSVFFNKSINSKLTEIKSYENLSDFISERKLIRERNPGNTATYINVNEGENEIIVYGKIHGATSSDTINICGEISRLNVNNYKLIFFEILTENIKGSIEALKDITMLGFEIRDSDGEKLIIEKELESAKINSNFDKLLKRNQPLFIKNIIQKYINEDRFDLSKCFACGYFIESNFIAAHIYRFSDIVNDYLKGKISISDASNLIVSGENGFFLCPNQDKEFEKGYIYFDINKKVFLANKKILISNEFKQISENINSQNFTNIKFLKEFEDNIHEHINRINI